jgi:lipid-A-disaccharide synthase
VALLPGSRKKEVEQILPVVLDAAKYVANRHPARFLLVRAPAIGKSEIEMTYQNWSKKRQMSIDLEFCEGNRFEALQRADCAIVKSGTSTLETMLAAVPFAMVYRISFLSWFSLRPFVRTNTYCLANLIAGKQIVPEFVQNDATGERIGAYILTLLNDPESRTNATNLLTQARKRLGSLNAYREGARRIITSFLIQGVDKS